MGIKILGVIAVAMFPVVYGQQAVWGQCGGINWTGQTTCVSGTYCFHQNPYYFQCIPGTASTTTSTTTPIPPSSTTSTTFSSQSSTSSTTISSTTLSTSTRTSSAPVATGTGLDAKMKNKGKKYWGSILDSNTIGDSSYISLLQSEHGAVTPENSMKWDATEKSRGSFTLSGGDSVVNWATSNNKMIRGHTLVWYNQLPSWVSAINDKATLTSVIQTHVTTLVSRWKGKIYAWDVVNEIFEDSGAFRNSVFYNVLGEEFVDIAFKAARAADPAAKLYINDYNLDYAGAKVNNLIALVNRAIARGVPIDGIGSQAHLIVGNGAVGSVASQLALLAGTAVTEVAITELDIRMTLPETSALDNQQATDYGTVVKACLSVPKCVGVTAWGLTDKYSWVPQTFSGQGAALPWNANYVKKPAYTGASNAMA